MPRLLQLAQSKARVREGSTGGLIESAKEMHGFSCSMQSIQTTWNADALGSSTIFRCRGSAWYARLAAGSEGSKS